MQSSSLGGRREPGSGLSAWTASPRPCSSLALPGDGRRRSLSLQEPPVATKLGGRGGRGPPLSPGWGLRGWRAPESGPLHGSFLARRPAGPLAQTPRRPRNGRLRLSALNGHGIDELSHLVGQPLPPGLLVLLQRPDELRDKSKGGGDVRAREEAPLAKSSYRPFHLPQWT